MSLSMVDAEKRKYCVPKVEPTRVSEMRQRCRRWWARPPSSRALATLLSAQRPVAGPPARSGRSVRPKVERDQKLWSYSKGNSSQCNAKALTKRSCWKAIQRPWSLKLTWVKQRTIRACPVHLKRGCRRSRVWTFRVYASITTPRNLPNSMR